MVFFGAFRNGADLHRFHIFQIATLLALWGVVISAVYMLRAYRAVFMGTLNERWKNMPDLNQKLRIPIVLLVAAMLFVGFFPQTIVHVLRPTFESYFVSK
jgi:NADH-quinone oxidoreductase subunit M